MAGYAKAVIKELGPAAKQAASMEDLLQVASTSETHPTRRVDLRNTPTGKSLYTALNTPTSTTRRGIAGPCWKDSETFPINPAVASRA